MRSHALRSRWLVVAVLIAVIGATASVLFAQRIANREQASVKERFERATSSRAAAVVAGFANYENALLAVRSHLTSSDRVGRVSFRRFVRGLQIRARYPGMEGVGFIAAVRADDLRSFEAAARADGQPSFHLHPPGVRPEHFVILYAEASEAFGAVLGLDIPEFAYVYGFLSRARDTGRPTLTGKTVLAVDRQLPPDRQPVGFGFLLPVYRAGAPTDTRAARRAALLGWVATPFRADDLLREMMSRAPSNLVGVQLFDVAARPGNLIGTYPASFTPSHGATDVVLRVGDRRWLLRVGPLPGQLVTSATIPWLAGTGGTLLSIAFGLLVLLVGNARRSAASLRQASEQRERAAAEHRELQGRLHESQRRESLGLLAGGIAHDFNNLLVGVIGNADVLRTDLAGTAHAELATQIEVAGRRAAGLTRQMLAYSGQGKFVVETVSLSGVVQELLPLLGSVISKKARIDVDFADEGAWIQADATQVQQIAMNLITNASEALDDTPGTIRVTARAIEADRDFLTRFTTQTELAPGRYVSLTVSDTGRGMDEATKEKIFDPYFTTKFTGRGLGLAAVLGIVEGHGGGLRVDSEPGVGSTFTIVFPAGEKPVAKPVETDPPAAGENRVVLFADDEEVVRSIGRQMLETSGYTVIEARDGIEAVGMFERNPDAFDFVVLDLMMPGYNGEQAFERIRAIRPDVAILVSSGYNAQQVSTRFAGAGSAAFLQKPYGREDLISALAEAAARAGSPTRDSVSP